MSLLFRGANKDNAHSNYNSQTAFQGVRDCLQELRRLPEGRASLPNLSVWLGALGLALLPVKQ